MLHFARLDVLSVVSLILATVSGALRAAAPDENHSPPPFAAACFDDFSDRQPYPTVEDVRRWLAPAGQPDARNELEMIPYRLHSHSRSLCRFSGLFRLGETWQSDSVLRISLLSEKRLKFYFWNGQLGVSLWHMPESYRCWAGFGAQRDGKTPQPTVTQLLATDNERYRRLGLGTVEIRFQDNKLVLSRGEFVLLVVPFSGLPQEVYLEGSGVVRGIEMARSGPAPLPQPTLRPTILQAARPADLDFAPVLPPGAQIQRLTDGRIQLDKPAKGSLAVAKLLDCPDGLFEVIAELEDFDAGTGLSLCDEEGKEIGRFGFFRHKETGQVVFGPIPAWHNTAESVEELAKRPARTAHRHQWIRLVAAGGLLTAWTSGDGVHWSWPGGGSVAIPGPCRQIGLYCLAGEPARSIKLRAVELRRFVHVPALASAALVDRVPALAAVDKLESWDAAVAKLRPKDIAADEWRRACILRSVQQNLSKAVCQPLLHRLVAEAIDQPGPIEDKLGLIDETALLSEYIEWLPSSPFADYFAAIERQLIAAGDPAPFSRMFPAMVNLPYFRYITLNVFPSQAISLELLDAAYRDRWPAVADLDRRLRYYGAMSYAQRQASPCGEKVDHLLRWAEDQLVRRGLQPSDESRAAAAAFFRNPLIEIINKETYNFLSEFRAALAAEAYRDACQLISHFDQTNTAGVVPVERDSALSVSLPVAIELALRDTPPLRAAMEEQVGPLGQLRIRQSLADGDTAAVQAATVQFRGTKAATEARLWLADRAFSSGAFHEAVSHYRDTLPYLTDEQRPQTVARLRLAGAMLGRDVGRAPTEAIDIGGTRIEPAAFERLVADQRKQRAKSAPDPLASGLSRCPPVGKYRLKPPLALGLRPVRRPEGVPFADWYNRQLGTAVSVSTLIVANPVQMAAFDTATDKGRWQARAEPAGTPPPLVAMTPVVLGRWLVARRAVDNATELVAIDVDNGGLAWRQSPPGRLASDPFAVGRRLFALTIEADGAGRTTLASIELDPFTGRLLRTAPLLDLRDTMPQSIQAAVTTVNDNLIITAGGYVLCADLDGRLRWRRQQLSIRAPSDEYVKAPEWFAQRHAPALADESYVYASQPGMFGIECLDLATGRLVWRAAIFDMLGLVGRDNGDVIVETHSGFWALDSETGKTSWRHMAADRSAARLLGSPGGLLYVATAQPADDKAPRRASLVWVDTETGQTAGECELTTFTADESLGPFLTVGNRQWIILTRRSGEMAEAALAEIVERK